MDCPSCAHPNPDENRFCGACGAALADEPETVGATAGDAFQRQVDQAVEAKFASFAEREVIELRATEEIVDRAWKWITRFAYVVGVPVAAIGVTLGFLGVGSINELRELQTDAKAQLKSALETASQIDAQATAAESEFADAVDRMKTTADVAVAEAESLRSAAEQALGLAANRVAEISERADSLTKRFDDASVQLARLEEIGDRIPEIERKVAEVEGIQENVAVLTQRVTAGEKFSEALSEDNIDRKIALYSETIGLDPTYSIAYANRGDAYFKQAEYTRAIADYNRAVELDLIDAWTYANRGYAYIGTGDYDRAIVDLDKAIKMDPAFALAYSRRGFAYYHKVEYDRAITDADKAIELDPDLAGAYKVRGLNRFYLGQFAKAETDLGISAGIDPSDHYPVIWRYLAGARGGAANTELLRQASADLDLGQWPGPVIRMYLGELKPANVIDAARNRDPKIETQQVCEANFYIGVLRRMDARDDEAATLFQQAKDTCPRDYIEYSGAKAELLQLTAN